MAEYIFSIIESFPNKKVAPTKLESEIRSSKITIALDYISTAEDDCFIYFKEELSSENLDVLKVVLSEHQGEEDIEIPVKAPVVITGLPDYTGHSIYRKSFFYKIEPNKDQTFPESFSEPLALQGGEYVVIGEVNIGDYLEMMITDEMGVLGMGPKKVLQVFFDTEYLCQGAKLENFVTPDMSNPISTFLSVTLRYVSVGEKAPIVIVRYNFRRAGTATKELKRSISKDLKVNVVPPILW